jgi:hypothetical protein
MLKTYQIVGVMRKIAVPRRMWEVIRFIGLRWLVVGFLGSILVGIWAHSLDMPAPIIFALGLIIFAHLLYLIKLPAAYRLILDSRKQSETDWGLERYYDWLIVNKKTYLIYFDLEGDTREKKELATKIAILDHKAKRQLSPPNSRWDDVNRQLINVITLGHAGLYAQAKALLRDAENTYRIHRQSRIRERYLIGFSFGIVGAITLGYVVILILNHMEPTFHVNFLVEIFLFAGMGSIVSALTRLNSLDLREDSNDFDIMLSGSARPIVAIFFALISYIILSVKAFRVNIGDSDANPNFIFFLAAFLCGFSERFAHDIVAHIPFAKRSRSSELESR